MIYALGEALLDIIISNPDQVVLRPGGAMLNAAVSLGRSDVPVSIVSELGDDGASAMITSFLQQNNINTGAIRQYSHQKAALALAWLDAQKKPAYTFYKSYPDQRSLLAPPVFSKRDMLLFGSLYALDPSIRKDIITYVQAAQSGDALLYYDPNIRNAHHLKEASVYEALLWNMKQADIIKGSDEDFNNIFGTSVVAEVFRKIRSCNPVAWIIYTRGQDGILVSANNITIELAAMEVSLKSTIGAGDAFSAGFLSSLHKNSVLRSDLMGMGEAGIRKHLDPALLFASKVCGSYDNYIVA